MGAGASKAEKIYKAAKSNDVGALQVQPPHTRIALGCQADRER